MDGWRISKRRYANPPTAAFDGEGSRRRGGRWTPPGERVAYASSSLALASVEYFVNLDPQDAPSGLVSVHTSIPDGIRCERVNISSLPESWRGVPFPQELWAVGNALFATENEGATWTPLSGDLTTNDKSKQKSSGGPITKDNTGVEVYCTIFTAANKA